MRLVLLSVVALVLSVRDTAADATPVATSQQVLDEVNAARAARGPAAVRPGREPGPRGDRVRHPPGPVRDRRPHVERLRVPAAGHGLRAAAGCAGWPVGNGVGLVLHFDGYQFAGAGYCVGPDGRRYMHLFVR